MSPSDYYFVDEKINMGIFREYGLIDEFYAKMNYKKISTT